MSPYLRKSMRTAVFFRQFCTLTTMAAEDMFLYWGSGSVPCWKAMLALEEKGFSGYKNKMISFDKKEEKSPEILKLNPRRQSTFKEKGTQLIPTDPNERALVLQRMHEAAANLMQKMLLDFLYEFFDTKEEDMDPNILAKKTETLKEELDRWDGYLGQTGAFLAGPNFTMADIYFFPFIGFGVRLGLSLDKFPNLKAYYERACARPSVKATWPPHWKENKPSMTPLAGRF
ncbi:glutathione S-transferase A-like isoform X2 [Ostrea edulis]|uniref:glutathione S-transferase A-like isoform X2 n=1 Tax=Ostrea edulis TaxID=37623 RepID=UPI0020957271|nr:glutathione S-transferase A-like isoform X2 [Ostrea edulis]